MTDRRHTPQPLLSFCIPTYNRVGAVLPLVRRILLSPSSEFEVIVSDNASSDDTVAQLGAITDPRLVVLQNTVNRGALFNQVNVLVQGQGTYSALLLDKDSVDPKLIQSFLKFLRDEAPVTGYCEYHQAAGTPARHFQRGEDALRGMAYSCHHPSGYFFRKADLKDIRVVERFSDHGVVGNFPFEFMQAELALRGPAAIFQEPVFIPETLQAARAIQSFTINGSKGNAFFQPNGRLNTAVRFSSHILDLPIEAELKKRLVLDRFIQGLAFATVAYRSIMANEAICDHYHIATRRVGRLELLQIMFSYYCGFFRQLNATYHSARGPAGIDVLVEIVRRLIWRIGKRLGLTKRTAEQS